MEHDLDASTSTAGHHSMPVALVSMPWADARHPSLQLGSLGALVAALGYPVRTLHASLDLAARIGLNHYGAICHRRAPRIGDWLFSMETFGSDAPDPDARMPDELAACLPRLGCDPQEASDWLRHCRNQEVPAFLDGLLEGFAWSDVAVVGFTTTFQQSVASIALARRLKRRYPHLVTVFGGAEVHGAAGTALLDHARSVDLVVTGEGEVTFPRLLSLLSTGEALSTEGALERVPGIAYREAGQVRTTPAPQPLADLDELPVPDYQEYYHRARSLDVLTPTELRRVPIPVETSRGCWWAAQARPCVFCGLNGADAGFRVKSSERVRDELAAQAYRHGFRFDMVDNLLPREHLDDLLPSLAAGEPGYDLFYEVRGNLTREDLRMLSRAGVTRLQPGLESLSTRVLLLMGKGVRAAQNVNLLRWARYYGIQCSWNLIWGIPGETEEDYDEQAAAMAHLVHLQPPVNASRVWLDRFSPMFADPGRLRLQPGGAERSYQYVYPHYVDLDQVAYSFDFETDGGLDPDVYQGVRRAVARWSKAWSGTELPTLEYRAAPHIVQITDRRGQGRNGTYRYCDLAADLYLACCDQPVTAATVRQRLGLRLPVPDIEEFFDELHQHGLVFRDGRSVLALAIPAVGGRLSHGYGTDHKAATTAGSRHGH